MGKVLAHQGLWGCSEFMLICPALRYSAYYLLRMTRFGGKNRGHVGASPGEDGEGYGRVATGVGVQSCGGSSGTCVPGCRVLWEAEGTGHQLWSQNGGKFGKKR